MLERLFFKNKNESEKQCVYCPFINAYHYLKYRIIDKFCQLSMYKSMLICLHCIIAHGRFARGHPVFTCFTLEESNVLALRAQCRIEENMVGTFAEGSLGRKLRISTTSLQP